MGKNRNIALLILFLGLLHICAYYLSGATVRSDGSFPVGQPDTLLYCQAARRIVEGFPFSYSEGTAVSTGTTSVLYPFVLAIPVAFGVRGDNLFLVGFLLNALFYLVFLLGWGVVIREKCEGSISRVLCSLLVALSGQAAFCAMSASDTGMWMAASAIIVAGLATGKRCVYLPFLVLSPWIRPEGAMLVCALAICSFCALICGKRESREVLFAALIAVGSILGVLCLNYYLSGLLGFSSVANKGHFVFMPFSTGVILTISDFIRLLKVFFLGLPPALFSRNFHLIPLLGAIFLWLGVFTHEWRRDGWWKGAGWLLAGLFSIVSVAFGGCEGQNMDRYLAWFLPTIFIFVSNGAAWFAERLNTTVARIAPALILVLYAAMSAVADVMLFHDTSAYADVVRSFASACEATLPAKASLGVFGRCGVAYQMSPRKVRHLSGIYSPEFKVGRPPQVLEILKHESDKRFEYWYLNEDEDRLFLFSSGKTDFDAIGKTVLAGPQSHALRKADWSIFDAATDVPAPSEKGRELVTRVDVCYDPDEKSSNYEPLTIYDQPIPHPFTQVAAKDGGVKIFESGRLLLGGDEMTVFLTPGRDVEVVMRTLSKAHAVAFGVCGISAGGDCSFKSPMELFVTVDGESVGKVSFDIRDDGFTDAHFMIPGSAIKNSPCRIGFHGEHVACCYWFYQ